MSVSIDCRFVAKWIVAFCILLASFATPSVAETGWRQVQTPPGRYAWKLGPPVRVYYHDSLRGFCDGPFGGRRYTVGCAIRKNGRCTIHLLRNTSPEILAHEKAHCKGWQH